MHSQLKIALALALLALLGVAMASAAESQSGLAAMHGNGRPRVSASPSRSPVVSASPSPSPAPYADTACPPTRFTWEGMWRTEEFKPPNLGRFNCTGSVLTFDPATARQTSATALPWFPLSTLYETACGCYVTRSFGSDPVYEYGTTLGGHAMVGTCFKNNWVLPDGSVRETVANARTVNRIHRDVTYVDSHTGALAYHQTYYPGPDGSEMVLIRGIDPTYGSVWFIQNLICRMVERQTAPL
jgi:hypothetical protein